LKNKLAVKRIFVILFLLSLLAPPGAMWLYLQCRKQQVRASVKAQLVAGAERPELVELKFARQDLRDRKLLRWEHAREFEYQGQMYDVVEQYEEGDSIRYICYWDKLETKLNQQLNQLAALALGHAPDAREALGKLFFLLKSLYCTSQPLLSMVAELGGASFFIDAFGGDTEVIPPPSPPPEA
jgi:hypothetical protein